MIGINRLTIHPHYARNLSYNLGPRHPLVVATGELRGPYVGSAEVPGHGVLDIYSPPTNTPLEDVPEDYYIARYTNLRGTMRVAFFYLPGSDGSRAIAKLRDATGGSRANSSARPNTGSASGMSEALRRMGLRSGPSSGTDEPEEGAGSLSSDETSRGTRQELLDRLRILRGDNYSIPSTDGDSDGNDGPLPDRPGSRVPTNVGVGPGSSNVGNGSMEGNRSQGSVLSRGLSSYGQPFAGFSGAYSFAESFGSLVGSLTRSTEAIGMASLDRFVFGRNRHDSTPLRRPIEVTRRRGTGMELSRSPRTSPIVLPALPIRQRRIGNMFRQMIPSRIRGIFGNNNPGNRKEKRERRKLVRRRGPKP